ncbi:hypothetical protein [Pseudoduganella violacea]|uniref:DUF2059 domain-containing protein n=1 Tax=Pseudoduganella violacea TaxID=1715466 RepID=A0A7W5BAU6_9BURK|nr:hypothetical protein [Pseudoduganella violacea]MBB3119516.1 hypothetical protein [Pseudoduganella violacea]
MKRLLQLLLLPLLAASHLASAGELEEYARAANRLVALSQTAQREGKEPPRMASGEGKELITLLSDRQRFLDSRSFTPGDMSELSLLCGEMTKTMMNYMMFNLQRIDRSNKDAAALSAAVAAASRENIHSYQDEIAQLMPMTTLCMGKQLPVLEQFLTTLKPDEFNEARQRGLAMTQNGLFTSMLGALSGIGDPTVSEANQLKMVGALAEVAPVYAAALPLENRSRIVALARMRLLNSAPAFKDALLRILQAMENAECTGLCRRAP